MQGTEDGTRVDNVWGAAIRNASDLPIFDVRVIFYLVNDQRDGSPWTTDERYASVERFRVIPPEQIRHLELPQRIRAMADECNDDVYLVGLEFTDANGQRAKGWACRSV